MTEAEWQACRDPGLMLNTIQEAVSPRKARLLACAALLAAYRSFPSAGGVPGIVSVAERYADGDATAAELQTAHGLALQAQQRTRGDRRQEMERRGVALEIARAEILATSVPLTCRMLRTTSVVSLFDETPKMLRDIFGNPFRPVSIEPAWLAWNRGTIPRLAQTIYDDRAFDRMPILADALEDAGCGDPAVLDHCRQPGEHVRGCWLIDLLCGRE